MKSPPSLPIIITAILAIILCFWLGLNMGSESAPEKKTQVTQNQEEKPHFVEDVLAPTKTLQRQKDLPSGTGRINPNAIPGEVVLSFATDEDYQAFLDSLKGTDIALIGKIDALRSLRLRGKGLSDLLKNSDLDASANTFFGLPPIPRTGGGGIQADAVGFGNSLLEWLGIEDRPLTWGEGVKIAVIDSGVESNITFQNPIQEFDLRADPSAPRSVHGTPVASIIAGGHPEAPGVAPGAEILSLVITDAQGRTTAFDLANAIVRAVDEGAAFVNISLGGSPANVLESAVRYANDAGVVLIVAPGNNGTDTVASPANYAADYPNVASVGAIDARGELLDFSDRDSTITMNAPGLGIRAALPDDNVTNNATGTSFSAPAAAGVMVAHHSLNPDNTPQQTLDFVSSNTAESGLEGNDDLYGGGELSTKGSLNEVQPNEVDLRIAGQVYIPPSEGQTTGEIVLVIENSGQAPLFNSEIKVSGDVANSEFTIPSLAPGDTTSISYPVGSQIANRPEGFIFETTAIPNADTPDVTPRDNERSVTITPTTP